MGLKIQWEKKPPKPKQQVRNAERLKKHIGSTLDWMDIFEVEEHRLVLKNRSLTEYTKGIKLRPVDIFIMEESEQASLVGRLRTVFNSLSFELYHGFVFNPVNLDREQSQLLQRLEHETSEIHRNILEDDIMKNNTFIHRYRELEFFICVQHDDEDTLEEQFRRLNNSLQGAGFITSVLNRIDYQNYASYLFESQLISDFIFTEGAFEVLAEGKEDPLNSEAYFAVKDAEEESEVEEEEEE